MNTHPHVFIAGWLFFWLKESFTLSQVLVTINTTAQLFAVSRLPPLTTSSHPLLRTTHFVAKTFAGIGILDFVDNGGVALVRNIPNDTKRSPNQCLSHNYSEFSDTQRPLRL